jgi:hypothetical protein
MQNSLKKKNRPMPQVPQTAVTCGGEHLFAGKVGGIQHYSGTFPIGQLILKYTQGR